MAIVLFGTLETAWTHGDLALKKEELINYNKEILTF